MARRRVAHHQPDRDRRQRDEDDDGAERRPPADVLRGPGERRGGGEIADQADRQHHGGERGKAIRRKPARDEHHAADQHHAAAGAHQHPAGQEHRPARRQREHRAADGGEHQHADDRVARPEAVEEEAAGDLHRGKAEEERAGQRTQRLRPDGEVAHQVEADGDVGGAEKMTGDIGGSHGRDDDQAPAVGERPLGGLHEIKAFPVSFIVSAASLCGRRAQFNRQSRLLQRQRHAAEHQHHRDHFTQTERLAQDQGREITPISGTSSMPVEADDGGRRRSVSNQVR